MEVICIDNSNRPNEVPANRWLQKDKRYTIVKVCYMTQQGIYGCKLAELDNDDLFPWSYFALYRFAVTQQQVEDAIEEKELEVEHI